MTKNVSRRRFLSSAGLGAAAAMTVPGTGYAEATSRAGRCKIIGVSCSMRTGKTTATALDVALQAAKEVAPDKIEVELVELADMQIPAEVVIGKTLGPNAVDDFPAVQQKLTDPAVAGILVGTPVYFANMSSLCKVFLERCGACRKQGFALSGKIAGVLAVGGVRSGGQELTIQSVQAALLCQEMIVVGDGRPTAHFGATLWNQQDAGVETDEFGLSTARNLGRHVAELAIE